MKSRRGTLLVALVILGVLASELAPALPLAVPAPEQQQLTERFTGIPVRPSVSAVVNFAELGARAPQSSGRPASWQNHPLSPPDRGTDTGGHAVRTRE